MSFIDTSQGTQLDEYPLVPRGPPPQPTYLGILSGYPAIQSTLADILGYQVISSATDLLAGSWYFLDASQGAFGATLPAGGGLNPGDSIGICTDQFAYINAPIIYTAGGDLIEAGVQTGPNLICNVNNDRFRFVWAESVWQAC